MKCPKCSQEGSTYAQSILTEGGIPISYWARSMYRALGQKIYIGTLFMCSNKHKFGYFRRFL